MTFRPSRRQTLDALWTLYRRQRTSNQKRAVLKFIDAAKSAKDLNGAHSAFAALSSTSAYRRGYTGREGELWRAVGALYLSALACLGSEAEPHRHDPAPGH